MMATSCVIGSLLSHFSQVAMMIISKWGFDFSGIQCGCQLPTSKFLAGAN